MVCETRSIIPRHFPYHVLPLLQIGSWESNRGNGNSLRKPHHRPCGAAGAGMTRGSPLPPSPFHPPLPPAPILRARNTLISPPFPRAGRSEFSQLRENDAGRLFVIREAAGEISRRSAPAATSRPGFLRSSSPPYLTAP